MDREQEIRRFFLLQVNDALFPIGGYSHSQGLETYIQQGSVCDEKTAAEYIHKNCVSHLLIPICWQFALRGNWQIKMMQTDWMSWKKSSEHPGFLLNSGKRPEKWVPVLQKQSKNCMQKRCR